VTSHTTTITTTSTTTVLPLINRVRLCRQPLTAQMHRPPRGLLLSSLLVLTSVRRVSAGRAPRSSGPPRGGGLTGPKAKQSLGQNFLQDVGLARQIAGSLPEDDTGGELVIELGPGQGAISGHLLERYPSMTAVEIDERMIEHLTSTLPSLAVEHGDMLQLDLAHAAADRGGELLLVSNTPLYLTSPLLFKLLASVEHVHTAVLTTQREVADKILSPPRSKNYGILSVMLQLFGRPEYLFDLPAEAFEPAPKVESSVLRFSPSAVPSGESEPLTAAQRAALLALLKLTFESRRKMLRVSLKRLLESGAVARPDDDVLTLRPEQLSPSEFLGLARTLFGDDLGGTQQPMTKKGHVILGGARRESRAARKRGDRDGEDGRSGQGEELEEAAANSASPMDLLEEAHVSKGWKSHKAGWQD